LTRSINIGGNAVTRRVMDQMSVPEAEAEQIKMDLGNMAGASTGVGGLPAVLDAVMQPMLNEIRYAFQLYAGMELTEFKKVEKIVLTGGSSHLPRIVEFLKESLNMNVYRGDPWARVVFPEDLRPVLDEIGPRPKPTLYACVETACSMPVSEPEKVQPQLRKFVDKYMYKKDPGLQKFKLE